MEPDRIGIVPRNTHARNKIQFLKNPITRTFRSRARKRTREEEGVGESATRLQFRKSTVRSDEGVESDSRKSIP